MLDGIWDTSGIEGIFIGPCYFSVAWTKGELINLTLEEMIEMITDVGRRTCAAGKHACIYVADPKISGLFFDMDY